jgi:hypothetical protein
MIAALKQHYEYYHAGDLTALKKLYEYHAENCAKAAELTEDTQQREEYLELAREWTEAARSLEGHLRRAELSHKLALKIGPTSP